MIFFKDKLDKSMNPELKEKWLKVLRAGTYPQGADYLRKGGKFCCLGVLCDIVDSTAWENKSEGWSYQGECSTLPVGVQKLAKIDMLGLLPDPVEIRGQSYPSLVSLNDAGFTFSEIADIIEEWL